MWKCFFTSLNWHIQVRNYPCTHKAGCNVIFWELVGLQSLYLSFFFPSFYIFLLPSLFIFPTIHFSFFCFSNPALLSYSDTSFLLVSFIHLSVPPFLSFINFLSFLPFSFYFLILLLFIFLVCFLLDFSSFHFTFSFPIPFPHSSFFSSLLYLFPFSLSVHNYLSVLPPCLSILFFIPSYTLLFLIVCLSHSFLIIFLSFILLLFLAFFCSSYLSFLSSYSSPCFFLFLLPTSILICLSPFFLSFLLSFFFVFTIFFYLQFLICVFSFSISFCHFICPSYMTSSFFPSPFVFPLSFSLS